jgi:hypothetical protein
MKPHVALKKIIDFNQQIINFILINLFYKIGNELLTQNNSIRSLVKIFCSYELREFDYYPKKKNTQKVERIA